MAEEQSKPGSVNRQTMPWFGHGQRRQQHPAYQPLPPLCSQLMFRVLVGAGYSNKPDPLCQVYMLKSFKEISGIDYAAMET